MNDPKPSSQTTIRGSTAREFRNALNIIWTGTPRPGSVRARAPLASRLASCPELAEARDPQGLTLLHHAAAALDGEVAIPVLLDAGAGPNARSPAGETPLHRAAAFARFRTMKLLIEARAVVSARNHAGVEPLHCLTTAHYDEDWDRCLDLLVDSGADLEAHTHPAGSTPLLLALRNYDLSRDRRVRSLLAVGADPNAADTHAPLHLLAAEREVDGSPAYWLRGAGRTKIETGAAIGARMHWQANANICLSWLLKAGADVNPPAAAGKTPLHYAAEKGNVVMTSRLLEAGASPWRLDSRGYTPAQTARRSRLLIQDNRRGQVTSGQRRRAEVLGETLGLLLAAEQSRASERPGGVALSEPDPDSGPV